MSVCLPATLQVHALGLLRFMLTSLNGVNGPSVGLAQAAEVEAGCLDFLDWRLGPFFAEDDDLSSTDERLWAGAMGRPEQRSSRDCGSGGNSSSRRNRRGWA